MSNGFKALRHVGGGVQRLAELPIGAATAAIFNGDMVGITSGKLVKSATDTVMQGSFLGCMYVTAKGEQKFSPDWVADANATEIKGLFNDDGNISYAVTGDVVLVAGDLCDAVVGTGTALTGQSTSTVTTSANGDFVVKSVLDVAAKLYEVQIVA